MATKKSGAASRRTKKAHPAESKIVYALVVTFTTLSIIFAALAYWQYGR